VDIPGEIGPAYPPNTAYYDRVYGRGGWTSAVALNLAIGQGENSQTLMNMVRFYAALGNGGHVPTPYLVVPRVAPPPAMHLADTTLLTVRQALLYVVEQGTARGIRLADLHIAGKTGTAQNPHGLDHGWFVAFAPAEAPTIVVGAILEFGEHGTTAAPYVARVIERFLIGPDRAQDAEAVPLAIPRDSAPRDLPLDSGPRRAPAAGAGRRTE
jgi:penicillin-binding protein 2